ncbi:MAG: hypothetical protein FWG42_09310 [Clostridiales bacterium]|nr:hypothetical protein [Clostridiales bacterium]
MEPRSGVCLGKLKRCNVFQRTMIIAVVFAAFSFTACGGGGGQTGHQSSPAEGVSALKPKDIVAVVTTENGTRHGVECLILRTSLDLDGDGAVDQLTAYFTPGTGIGSSGGEPTDAYGCCEIEIASTGTGTETETFSLSWIYDNLFPQIKFADFDAHEQYIQFYLEGDGPSGDPRTKIFTFDGMRVYENLTLPGFVTEYDGNSRIFSFGIYSVNCYYDLYDGLTPLPKEDIVGTEIQRSFGVLLFTELNMDYTCAVLSGEYENQGWKNYVTSMEEFVCLVPENTPLEVLDIEFVESRFEPGSLYGVPWLKVRTPEGTEGWFSVVYGD